MAAGKHEYIKTIQNLQHNKCYIIKVFILYVNSKEWYQYPKDNSQCHFTREGKPSVPGTPYLNIRSDRQITVEWLTLSNDNGTIYELQQRHKNDVSEDWVDIYKDEYDFYTLTDNFKGELLA